MTMKHLTIKETTIEDLENIKTLWNHGDVMFYVGFPNGLGVTEKSLKEDWYPNINQNHLRRHYSIYHDTFGFCGECYYEVGADKKAALDIKLMPEARGKGIGYEGLNYAIDQAFQVGHAISVYVDPHIDNKKALKLYQKLGFKQYPHPNPEYQNDHMYLELSRHDYSKS